MEFYQTACFGSEFGIVRTNSRNEVTVLTGLEEFYGASENVVADIDEQLVKIVGGLSANKLAEDKLR